VFAQQAGDVVPFGIVRVALGEKQQAEVTLSG
jgi:hypothetical protein